LPHNFSGADLLASLLAFVLFTPFAFIPGWVTAWAADLLEFRKRSLLARVAIAIPLSIGLTPVLSFLTGRFFPFSAEWVVFGFFCLMFPVTLFLDPREHGTGVPAGREFRRYGAIAGAWIALGIASLIDLQIGNRLYFPVIAVDYALRSPFVASIARGGIPAINPLFFPGHAVPLRYHYFWLIPCSLVDLLGSSLIAARQAIIGGTLWCGLALMSIVAAFLRFVHPAGAVRIHRRCAIAIGLLCVTGLDILPNLWLDFQHHPLGDPEWWNEQVSAWITSVLWVPHHTASLIAGLAATLIIWNAARARRRGQQVAWAVITGLCLATSIGSSLYVAMVFAAGLTAWICILLFRDSRGEAVFAAAAGVLAACMAAPHLLVLETAGGGTAAGGPHSTIPIAFAVRRFLPLWFSFDSSIHASPLRENLLNALTLPLNYFMELGVFLIGGFWTLRHWRTGSPTMDRYRLFTLTLGGASFLTGTFFRSVVIGNNDLGWRGFLLCQFVLLLWTVDLIEKVPARKRLLVNILIAIGIASSIYEVFTLRLYPIALDRLDIPREAFAVDHELGSRTYALRASYEALRNKLPASAIVQHNPVATPNDLPYGLYADRPVVADTPGCEAVFGGDQSLCGPIFSTLSAIFGGTDTAADLDRACTDLSISAVLVKDTDPVWKERESWVWSRRPVFANRFTRVVACGSGARRSTAN
jgi:hypothetical protein